MRNGRNTQNHTVGMMTRDHMNNVCIYIYNNTMYKRVQYMNVQYLNVSSTYMYEYSQASVIIFIVSYTREHARVNSGNHYRSLSMSATAALIVPFNGSTMYPFRLYIYVCSQF